MQVFIRWNRALVICGLGSLTVIYIYIYMYMYIYIYIYMYVYVCVCIYYRELNEQFLHVSK